MKPKIEDIKKIANIDLAKEVKRKREGKVEENVKIKIVTPLLTLLGYDMGVDLDFEHKVRNKKADIVVELNGKPRISVECKDLSENLDSHLSQAFNYACWKGFLLLVLTNGREIRVYKTWEAGSELEERLLFVSSLEKLPETFYQGKGLWNILSKDNVIKQSELIDKWKESQSKLPMMASYINGLLDDVSIRGDKKELLVEAFQFLETYQYSKSIELFRKCLSLGYITDSERLALHIQIGMCFFEQSKLIESHGAFNEGLGIAKFINDKYGMAVCLGNIGLIYYAKGDLDNALKYHQEALKIDKEVGYKQGEATDLGNIGVIYDAKGDLDNAFKYHQEALKIHREVGYKRGEATNLGNIGLIYKDKGDLDNALKYQKEALKIHREVGYKQGEATDLGNIGLIYRAKGDLDKAFKYQQEALKIDKEIGDKRGEADGLGNIGLIYYVKGDLDNAFKYHQEALKIDKEVGYKEGEANGLGNIGVIYRDKGDLDNALRYQQEALKLYREEGYKQGEANGLGNIGVIYRDKGDLDNALKYLKEALEIFDKFKLIYGRDKVQNAIDSIIKSKPRGV
ncbi:MAG: tetratricopeptide repeat protein [Dehalococcoidia bacterium]